MEASRYGSVFAIGRRVGLFARYDGPNWAVDAALTDGSLDGSASKGFGRGQRAATVRARTAVIEDGLSVHFGAYVRGLDYDGSGVTLQAGPHPDLAPKTAKVSLTASYGREARRSLLTGGELGVSAGRWYAALDAGRMEIDTTAGDFVVSSAALEASVALTGERRKYAADKGVFKPITPATPLGAGGYGALELTGRADRIDFGPVLGGETSSYTAGVTWTPRDGVRVLANYTTETASRFAPESHSYAVRLQLSF
jgi:phosphate-selective porin